MLLVTEKELELKEAIEDWADGLKKFSFRIIQGIQFQREVSGTPSTELDEKTPEIKTLEKIYDVADSIQIGIDEGENGKALWVRWGENEHSLIYNREAANTKADRADIVYSLMKFGMTITNLLSTFSRTNLRESAHSYIKVFEIIIDEYME